MAMSAPTETDVRDERDGLPFSLVILYGPLSGLEFPLSAGRHFFVTHRESLGREDPVDTAVLAPLRNTYVVPGPIEPRHDVPNFAITLGESEPEDHPSHLVTSNRPASNQQASHHGDIAIVEMYAETSANLGTRDTASVSARHTFKLGEGDLFEYAGLRFAWKRVGTAWPLEWTRPLNTTPRTDDSKADDDRRTNETMQARESKVEPAAPSDSRDSAVSRTITRKVGPVIGQTSGRSRARASWSAWALALFSLGAGAAALADYNHTESARLDTPSIESMLNDAAHRGTIRRGHDGVWYVLVASQRDATWAAQALRPVAGSASVQIRVERDETQRVESMLARQSVPFYAARFDSAKQMRLVLVGDPAAPPQPSDDALRKDVLASVPYIDDVRIERHLTAAMIAKAREGLDALNLRYRQSQRGEIATFELDGMMDDTRLTQFGEFAEAFSRDWGRQGIRFILDSPSDPARSRAYRVRARGFVSPGRDVVEFTSPVS